MLLLLLRRLDFHLRVLVVCVLQVLILLVRRTGLCLIRILCALLFRHVRRNKILGDVACSFAVPSASRASETNHAGVSLQSSRDKLRDDAHSSVLQLLNLLGPHSQGLK